MHFLSVVIPVLNEMESLGELQRELAVVLDRLGAPYEVIYIDDGSTDGSWATLSRLHAESPATVRALRLRRNFGQTAAMAAGFDAARGDVLITLDADLQNDPADISRLLEKMDEGYDVVSGWRADRQDDFLSRTLPSRVANGLISRLTGVHLHDYGCTLKVYRREVIAQMRLYGEMHRFLPALASWAGARVAEVKVNHRPRRYGTSKYGINRTVRVILDLITVKFLLSYSTKPMQVFGKLGFYCMGFGMFSGAITLFQKLLPPHLSINHNGWFFLAIFFLLGGMQMICMGLLGEINVRTYYESLGKPVYHILDACQAGEDGAAAPPGEPAGQPAGRP